MPLHRRPDGAGGWIWNVRGVDPLPYRLPELLAADATTVFIPTEERDADVLGTAGLVATARGDGMGRWHPAEAAPLRGRRLVLLAPAPVRSWGASSRQ